MTLPVKTQQEVDVTAEIGQVTAEIDQLKEELNRLSLSLNTLERQRNALSPVSKVPPELLFKIFYLSLQFMDASGHRLPNVFPERTRLAITHVSQRWRETSLNFPDLWAEIYLRENTSHQSIDMALRNSQNQPLYIEAPGPIQRSAASHIFGERLRSRQVKAIYLHALPLDFLMVFNLSHIRHVCKEVETFHLTLHQTLVLEKEFWYMITFQTFTRLRRVELNGWVNNPFPWIRCPSVTHLSIQPGLLATMESMRDLLAFLKISPQLEFLHIHFGSTSVNGERLVEDLHYHSSIYLPRLCTLRIKSNSSLPLCILLSALHIPPTIQVLDLSCSNHPPDAPRKVASALNLACSAVSPPRMVIVYAVYQPNGHHSAIPPLLIQSSQAQGDPRPQLDVQISITPAPAQAQVSLFCPFPHSNANDWLFSALRSIRIHHYPTAAVWQVLGCIPTLETVTLYVRENDDGFLSALRGSALSSNAASNPQNPGSTRTRPAGGFAALRNIEIEFRGCAARWDIVYALALGGAILGTQGGKKLDCLVFEQCHSNLGGVTSGILRRISENVRWSQKIVVS
ncbi:hypothetical protein D9611_009872 [Ephemerocybe angulata]|uniref:F-box domain-containing protein n=1 Tax=Ephemerocybe angulata TaxID=980116 RepID=A0A8H5CCS2_9AGAR|nr:hypothetical protein D9611_009872 [Tulosesus angulatus]